MSERSERAFWKKDEYTRDESREMATDIMATSTTKLTHPFVWLARFARRRFDNISNSNIVLKKNLPSKMDKASKSLIQKFLEVS